jgi:simple sugar transport system ATP-binding protein
MEGTSTPVLEARGVSKSFPGVRALSGVDLTLRAGEIHALMGGNGAGKSTLIKILTGAHRADAGEVLLDGKPLHLDGPHRAAAAGISTVYQEINLAENLSVGENVYLGRQPMGKAGIRWRELNARARAALARLGVEVDPGRTLADYPAAVRQMVAIARALELNARVLVLDEPTSSLDAGECARLFAVMRELRGRGLAILFITHFLDQTYAVADRITVLRNGERVGEWAAAALPRLELVTRMLGRELASFEAAPRPPVEGGAAPARRPLYVVKGLAKRGYVGPVDLELREGEVLGLAGLLGSGRSEVARLLFGAERADAGARMLEGRPVSVRTARDAVALGFGYCPEDRKLDGIVPELSVRENIVLALQARRGLLRRIPRPRQEEIAARWIASLGIKTPGTDQRIRDLSGGNQQKVVIARWLAAAPRFLILDEPTRGIDVGAKAEIMRVTAELARDGLAVLFISSELSEVVRCADRVAVMRDRRKVGELAGGADEAAVVRAIAKE